MFFGTAYNSAWATQSGWTAKIPDFANGQSDHFVMQEKLAVAGDAGAPLTWYGTGGNNSLNYPKGVVLVIGNPLQSAPIDQVGSIGSAGSGNVSGVTIPALPATISDNERYVAVYFGTDGPATITGPADLTDYVFTDQNQWASYDGTKLIATAGTIPGAEAATGGAGGWGGLAVTVRSTAAAPTPTPVGGATPVPGYATSWSGNSFGGAVNGGTTSFTDYRTAPFAVFVQPQMFDLTVTPAGLAVVADYWSEGHRSYGTYQNGQVVGYLPCSIADGTNLGGWAVTSNANYIWSSNWINGSGPGIPHGQMNLVKRYTVTGAVSSFSGGTESCGNAVVVDNPKNLPIFGMAASSTELFVADGTANQIKVYNASTMALARSWSFTNPRKIAYDPSTNTLWISQSAAGGYSLVGPVLHEDINGNSLSGSITDVGVPEAIAAHNSQIWIADDGADQDVKIYANGGGAHVSTFGDAGGYLSGTPGVWTPTKLVRPRGLGFDSAGNIYVMGGNGYAAGVIGQEQPTGDLREYGATGTLLWDLIGDMYTETAAIDQSTDGQDLYTKYSHEKMDYTKLTTGTGGGGTEWTQYGTTIDPFTYSGDPRYYGGGNYPFSVRAVGGHKYMAQSDMYGTHIDLYQMVSEIAKPFFQFSSKGTGLPNSPSGSYLWFDANNDGYPQASEYTSLGGNNYSVDDVDFDAAGNVWYIQMGTNNSGWGIVKLPNTGINANGQIALGAAVGIADPAPFTDVRRSRYDATNDVMYLSGYTAALPQDATNEQANDYGTPEAGTVLARYNNWSTGNRTALWTANLPYHVASQPILTIRDLAVAGNKVFAALHQTQTSGVPGPISHNIYVYDATSGIELGEMVPGVESNDMGWLDGPDMLNAIQRSTGEYVVTEQESVSGHVMIMRGLLNNFTQY